MIAGGLRIALLGLLSWLALTARAPDGGRGRVVMFDPDDVASSMRRAATGAPLLVVRDEADAPTPAELAVLSALASASADIGAALPAQPPSLIVGATPPLHAGRAAALPFRVQDAPGDTVRVVLSDVAGALDTAVVHTDDRGVAVGAFRVEPRREGWHEWIVALVDGRPDATARAGGWARASAPPRVLLVAGPPAWEPRFLARALEETGVRVTLQQPLAPDLMVGEEAAGAWTPAILGAYDVIIVMRAADAGPQRIAALRDFAAGGGGVVLAGHASATAALGLSVRQPGTPAAVGAARLDWTLPAEIHALPPASVSSDVVPLGRPAPGVVVGAVRGSEAAVLLAPVGRGRMASVSVTETWRWRMEAGHVREHRTFWRSLVDWAAAGRDSIVAEPDRIIVIPGEAVRVLVHGAGASVSAPLVLRRPDGSDEVLPLDATADAATVRFVAADTGVHTLSTGGTVLAAVRTVPRPSARTDAWSTLARLADASGGFAVPAGELGAAVESWSTTTGARDSRPLGPALLLAIVALLAGAEWTIRRFRGQP